jgi:argininosuccinate lyase
MPQALWSGGFEGAMHPALQAISDSLPQDMPLADADLFASAAYAQALGQCGVLKPGQANRLSRCLKTMRRELQSGAWRPQGGEDIHTAIEAEVTARLGSLGERLHTGRSRNDQVLTAFRLAIAEQLATLLDALHALKSTLLRRAGQELKTLLPAYTHLQRAQPISLAHWLMAHLWPLMRDTERLTQARHQALVCPLGAGAVSGHPFGLDRHALAASMGFTGVTQNSLDTVGDRDFAVEAVFACSLLAVHLSRFGEDLVLWSTTEFGFVQWPDALASGSSLMPNKKNPDLAELVRGRAAQPLGDLVSLLALLKGLPSSYQRDLQQDKAPVWRTLQTTLLSVQAMQVAVAHLEFDRTRMQAALSDDLLATEAADLLVQRGTPFRVAHHLVANCARAARQRHIGLKELSGCSDYALPAQLSAADLQSLSAMAAVQRRTAVGGTAIKAVREQMATARRLLAPKPVKKRTPVARQLRTGGSQ